MTDEVFEEMIIAYHLDYKTECITKERHDFKSNQSEVVGHVPSINERSNDE